MLSQKTRGFLKKLGIKLIAAALVLIGSAVLVDLSFRPIVETVNAYECHAALTSVINNAVLNELDNSETEYSKLVTLSTNADGEVISVESNVVGINKLRAAVANRIDREFGRMPSISINIPVGTLTGLQLLHGRGFNVGMKIKPLGCANTYIISEFSEAGINQTRHRIVIEIDTEADAIIPGFSSRVPVSTTIVAAETIIVGRVPDAYTHVISSDSDLVGMLQDYGATL